MIGTYLDVSDGFLFIGKDRILYRAIYAPDAFWNWDDYGKVMNGWGVEVVRLEFWHRVFPEYNH